MVQTPSFRPFLLRVEARGRSEVSSVVEKFREKYGASDVKKYYSKLDVAVVARMQ